MAVVVTAVKTLKARISVLVLKDLKWTARKRTAQVRNINMTIMWVFLFPWWQFTKQCNVPFSYIYVAGDVKEFSFFGRVMNVLIILTISCNYCLARNDSMHFIANKLDVKKIVLTFTFKNENALTNVLCIDFP